ncbi:MAG: DUF4136 domain-containing protein [Pseudomonadota bacterium]|nr:DUF4136 domain-containing protein [Pseudomonadota bacterium]
MNIFRKFGAAMLLGTAAALVSGCATGLPAKVTRYSAMPIPQGQTFYVVPASGQSGGLEFNTFAAMVAQELAAKGYGQAASPQAADMLVKVDYGVDEGETELVADRPFGPRAWGPSRWGPYGWNYRDPFYDPRWGIYYGRPYRSAWSRDPFYYGWDDPFWYSSPYAGYGSAFGPQIREYTRYDSHLDIEIARRVDNAPLFEGHVQARSQTDELGRLVPNLIQAMFTGFPGRSGETVRITVPAARRAG